MSGLSANVQGLLVLVGGTIVSVLLCVPRARAHALARARPGDGRGEDRPAPPPGAARLPSPGLPNRVLALDRAEQMLARARRQQTPGGGAVRRHRRLQARQRHLRARRRRRAPCGSSPTRLESVVREGDTAARLGGDEFVVLVEGSALDAGPELVAERLLDVLRQPYDMNAEIGRELSLTASIGIASGLRGQRRRAAARRRRRPV